MHLQIKIGFVLLSKVAAPIPSTRIAVLNMCPYLRAAQFDPHVVFEPDQNTETPDVSGLAPKLKAQGFQIIYFQKVHGASVLALAHELRALGIKTVFGVCDLIDKEMAAATDATIAVTEYLKSLYPPEFQHKIFIVHDGIEQAALHKTDWGLHTGSRRHPIRAVLVTSVDLARLPVLIRPPIWLQVTIVGRYPPKSNKLQRLREARWQFARMQSWRERWQFLQFLFNPRIERVAWDAVGVYDEMKRADIGIIPIETKSSNGALTGWRVKSENRLTMKMAMGLPVVATPIPAYEPVVQCANNAYLATSREDWLRYLNELRSPLRRQQIGCAARQSVLHRFSMQEQARLLIDVLKGLLTQGGATNAEQLPK